MSSPQPSKKELVETLCKCQTTLKRQTDRIVDLERRLAVAEAVANAKASARVASGWLGSDEFTELKAMLEKVLAKLDSKQ